jgi:hypothetical protein
MSKLRFDIPMSPDGDVAVHVELAGERFVPDRTPAWEDAKTALPSAVREYRTVRPKRERRTRRHS